MSTNKQSKKSAKIGKDTGLPCTGGPHYTLVEREAKFTDILRLGESRSEAPIYDICGNRLGTSWDVYEL